MDDWIGWHCLPEDRYLWYNRRRNAGKPVRVGEALPPYKTLVMCKQGYHASRKLRDALCYAPGPTACVVRLEGRVIDKADKSVGQGRVALAMVDATRELRLFAAWCAAKALQAERAAGREPDSRSWAAVRTAVR